MIIEIIYNDRTSEQMFSPVWLRDYINDKIRYLSQLTTFSNIRDVIVYCIRCRRCVVM